MKNGRKNMEKSIQKYEFSLEKKNTKKKKQAKINKKRIKNKTKEKQTNKKRKNFFLKTLSKIHVLFLQPCLKMLS